MRANIRPAGSGNRRQGPRMAEHEVEIGQVGEGRGAVGQSLFAGGQEGRAQQQVFGRVAAQGQFGRHRDARALGVGGAGGLDDAAHVAGQVTDGRIDLQQRHLDGRRRIWGRHGGR